MPNLFWIGQVGIEQRNIGDHAITYATKKYLAKHFSNYKIIEIKRKQVNTFFSMKVKPNDLIFFSSNGDFGDADLHWMQKLKKIISAHKKNVIVQLPVSVYYFSETEFLRDQAFFYDKQNFLLLCRTKRDLEKIKSFRCKKKVYPDLVLSLDPPPVKAERKGILYSLRNDRDSLIRRQTPKVLNIKGLRKIIKFLLRLNFNKQYQFSHDYNISYDIITDLNREESVNKIMKFYSSFELVISDRFHVWIFCYLTKTPFIALDGLVKKGYDVNPNINYQKKFEHSPIYSV